MSIRKWWYDGGSTKWQIAIGSIAILILLLIAFGPSIQGVFTEDEEKYLNFFQEFRSVMFGGVAVAVITGILIMFQEVVGMDREKNQKIFERRVILYKDFLELTMNIVDDDVLDDVERKVLMTTEKEMLLIASKETYISWCNVYLKILQLPRNDEELKALDIDKEENIKHAERVKKISILTTTFVNHCRKDLEIPIIDSSDKETMEIQKKIIEEMEKHMFTRKLSLLKQKKEDV